MLFNFGLLPPIYNCHTTMRVLAFAITLAASAGLASALCQCPDFGQQCCTTSGAPYLGGKNQDCDVTTREQFDLYEECCFGNGRFTACTAFPWLGGS